MGVFGNLFKNNTDGVKAKLWRSLFGYMANMPVYSMDDVKDYYDNGYARNPYVYRAVRTIADDFKALEWKVYNVVDEKALKQAIRLKMESPKSVKRIAELKRKALVPIESEIDATVSLLENPNPIMGWEGFIDFFITNYLISGNGFSELSKNSLGQIYRMYPIQSYQLQTIVGTYPNFIKSYELLNYTRSSVPAGEMLHIKTYNPDPMAGYFVGMAPLKAGALAVRQNNDGASWNISMMDNLGKIPGMFTSDDEMEPATKNTIKSEWDSKISGQPGKPLVLDGGAVKFTPFAMTMQDADFIESQKMTGEQIAMVYGLDPAAIGLGKTIYNNVREAKTAKFYSVIIPLADYFRSEFNRTVVANHNAVESELFKRPVKKYVDYDVESIEALQEDRKDVFARISAAKFLTYDEQRQEAGHDALNIEGKTNVPVGLIEKPTTEAVKPT